MAILTLPMRPGIRTHSWGLRTNSDVSSSPLSNAEQTAELDGAAWRGSLALPPMRRDLARAWCARLVELAGPAGRFYFGPPEARAPLGRGGGAPVVAGAGQSGRSLTIAGAPAGVTGWLVTGDYVHFETAQGRELKMLTRDVSTDGGGGATLQFAPAIRVAPADGAAIAIRDASCVMRIADDEQTQWTVDQLRLYGLQISIVESFWNEP